MNYLQNILIQPYVTPTSYQSADGAFLTPAVQTIRSIKNPGAIKEHLKSVLALADVGPAKWGWVVGWEAWDSARGSQPASHPAKQPASSSSTYETTLGKTSAPTHVGSSHRYIFRYRYSIAHTHTHTDMPSCLLFFFFAAAAVKAFCLLPFRLLSTTTTTGIGSPAAAAAAALAAFCCFAVFGAWLQLQFSVFSSQSQLSVVVVAFLRLGQLRTVAPKVMKLSVDMSVWMGLGWVSRSRLESPAVCQFARENSFGLMVSEGTEEK